MPKKHKMSSSDTKMRGKKGGLATYQQQDNRVNPMLGAAVGAVIGGAVGAAAAVALSNEETRKRVGDAVNNLQQQAADRLQSMTKTVKERAPKAIDSMTGAAEKMKQEQK